MPLDHADLDRLRATVIEYQEALAVEASAWEKQHKASSEHTAALQVSVKLRVKLQDFVGKTNPRVLVSLPNGTKAIVRDSEGYKEAKVEFYDHNGGAIR
jgi:hypothetical protein